MPELNDYTDLGGIAQEVTNLARDAAYVAVGFGVLGFQRAQVQRVELKSKLANDWKLDERVADVRQEVARGIRSVDDIVEHAVRFIETSLEPIEEQLPPGARDLVTRAHEHAREVRNQIRDAVVPAA